MHFIAGPQENGFGFMAETHSRGSSGNEQVASVKSHELTYISNQMPHGKDHAPGVARLHAASVEIQEQIEILRIAHFMGRDQPRTHRTESAATFAFIPLRAALHLKSPLRHVVGKYVTGDRIESLLFGHVARGSADDDSQFHL